MTNIKLIARAHDNGTGDGLTVLYNVLCDIVIEYDIEIEKMKSTRQIEIGTVNIPVIIDLHDDYTVRQIGISGERHRFGRDVVDFPDNIVWEDVDINDLAEQYASECREAYGSNVDEEL